jgi:hypothetical protein
MGSWPTGLQVLWSQVSRTGQAGLVALTGVAVAHRRLGPTSSATISTADRALPSSVVGEPAGQAWPGR